MNQNKTPSNIIKYLAIIGSVMQIGLFIGMAGTALGMKKAFDTLANSNASTEQLSKAIGEALVAHFSGFLLSFIGIILLIIAVVIYRYRARWMFYFLLAEGIIHLLAPPLGIFILAYLFWKRKEFLVSQPKPENVIPIH